MTLRAVLDLLGFRKEPPVQRPAIPPAYGFGYVLQPEDKHFAVIITKFSDDECAWDVQITEWRSFGNNDTEMLNAFLRYEQSMARHEARKKAA